MRIAITGIGVVSPIGIGKRNFWQAIKEGRSGVGPISLFSVDNLKVNLGAEVKDFMPEEILGQKGLRNLDRATKLLLCAGKLALLDSGLDTARLDTTRIGISIGTTFGSLWSISEFDKTAFLEGARFVNPAEFPNTVINSPPSQLAIRFNIKGPCATIASGFSSSIDALKYAQDLIRNGKADIVLAGGVEEFCAQVFLGFYKAKFLAGLKGLEISCPFDKRRNGIIFGEAGAVVVLEREDLAKQRHACIYGYICGCGRYFYPYLPHRYEPEGRGLLRAISLALEDAKLSYKDIDYISAAANSTPQADLIETKVIKEIFKEKARQIPVSSIKAMLGETFSAAGALNLVATLGAIEEGFVAPTINYLEKDEACDLDYVANQARPFKIKKALINSFGPLGNNSCLVISQD